MPVQDCATQGQLMLVSWEARLCLDVEQQLIDQVVAGLADVDGPGLASIRTPPGDLNVDGVPATASSGQLLLAL